MGSVISVKTVMIHPSQENFLSWYSWEPEGSVVSLSWEFFSHGTTVEVFYSLCCSTEPGTISSKILLPAFSQVPKKVKTYLFHLRQPAWVSPHVNIALLFFGVSCGLVASEGTVQVPYFHHKASSEVLLAQGLIPILGSE